MTGGGSDPDRPSLMRSLGLFVGHIARAVREDPSASSPQAPASPPSESTRQEVSRQVEEEHRDGVVLRRTTIEEIELPAAPPSGPPTDPPAPPSSDP